MFERFKLETVEVGAGPIRVCHGGEGPPLLLLHGHPRTHMTWGRVADLLAPSFSVVCPDLPGFGKSYQPEDAPDSMGSSKRSKAVAMVELMGQLGHEAFSVVGHDRGSLVAFRIAMDHPERVERLISVDGIPVIEHLTRADWRFARDWWHWFFYAQPKKPEVAIGVDPMAWYRPDTSLLKEDEIQDLTNSLTDPAVIHGMVEDYRAGIMIDHVHDRVDREAGRRVRCPMLCLWTLRDDLERLHGNPVDIWRPWAKHVTGYGLESGHHVAEENPAALAEAVKSFLRTLRPA